MIRKLTNPERENDVVDTAVPSDPNGCIVDAVDQPIDKTGHPETRLKRDGFVASVYLLIALTVLQKGLGFVRSIVICRYLEPEQLGLWSMALTFMETFVSLLILSIPACFGRYFEHFENRQQLKSFIRQSAFLIGIFFPVGIGVLFIFRQPLAAVVFGGVQHANMLVTSLIVVIPFGVFGVLVSMLTGLRKSQSRTIGEFVTGTSFTLLAIVLVVFGKASAFSIAYAFAGAYAIASFYSFTRVRKIYRSLDSDQQPLAWKGTWQKLAPVIFIFWLSDFLANLFITVDRYMIINFSSTEFGEPLHQVGNYEAAHVMPFLFSSFMAIVAKVLLPYLSKDWEAGKRQSVATKVNLSIKLGGIILILGATTFLWMSDYLFATLFKGKYGDGLEVLPFVVFVYVGSALSFLILNYFWCCEKGGYSIAALVSGLIVNVVVNALLIETFGIYGAAIGTAAAITTQFVFLWVSSLVIGLKLDWRVVVVYFSSLTLLVSPLVATLACGVIVAMAISGLLITGNERLLIRRARSARP